MNTHCKKSFAIGLLFLLLCNVAGIGQNDKKLSPAAQKKLAESQRKKAEEFLQVGLELAAEKKFAEAVLAFKQGIQADPTFLVLYEELGWTYNELENYQATIDVLQQAIRNYAASPLVFNELGFAFYKLNKPQDAITNYLQAVALKPDYEMAYRSLGDTYFYLAGAYQNALEPYKKALDLRPEQPNVNYNVGWILNDMEQFEAAIPYLQKAIEQKVNMPAFAHYELGFAQFKLKRSAEAITNFQQAIMLKKDYALAYFGLGDVYFANAKRFTEAAKFYQAGLKYKPDTLNPLYRLGWCLSELGKFDEALSPLQRVLDLQPDHVNAQRELGYAYLQLLDHEEAIRVFQRLLQANEKDALTLYYLGLSYIAKGDRTKAVSTSTSLSFLDASRAVTLNELIKKNFSSQRQ